MLFAMWTCSLDACYNQFQARLTLWTLHLLELTLLIDQKKGVKYENAPKRNTYNDLNDSVKKNGFTWFNWFPINSNLGCQFQMRMHPYNSNQFDFDYNPTYKLWFASYSFVLSFLKKMVQVHFPKIWCWIDANVVDAYDNFINLIGCLCRIVFENMIMYCCFLISFSFLDYISLNGIDYVHALP